MVQFKEIQNNYFLLDYNEARSNVMLIGTRSTSSSISTGKYLFYRNFSSSKKNCYLRPSPHFFYSTVKLDYNELGYKEQNEVKWLVSVILTVYFLGYNEQNPVITNKNTPKRSKIDNFSTIFPSIMSIILKKWLLNNYFTWKC